MKNTFLTLLVLCQILLTSCGSSGEEDLTENLPDVEKLITQITSQQGQQSNYYSPDKFIYENEKLVKAWFYSCSGALYEFDYGSNGKISIVYRKGSVSYSDIGTSIKTTGEVIKQVYDSDDRLISLTDDSGEILASLDYDSNNRLYKINIKDMIIGKANIVVFSDFDVNGNPAKANDGVSYIYDDKVNPIYILFKKYGFFNVEMCNSLDENNGLYFSPNNIKEIIDNENNDEIIFSAIYSYDSDDYPISNSFNSNSGSDSGDFETFSY